MEIQDKIIWDKAAHISFKTADDLTQKKISDILDLLARHGIKAVHNAKKVLGLKEAGDFYSIAQDDLRIVVSPNRGKRYRVVGIFNKKISERFI